jgi:hypothetical protein
MGGIRAAEVSRWRDAAVAAVRLPLRCSAKAGAAFAGSFPMSLCVEFYRAVAGNIRLVLSASKIQLGETAAALRPGARPALDDRP